MKTFKQFLKESNYDIFSVQQGAEEPTELGTVPDKGLQSIQKIVRANIHVTEWNPGHCIQYEKNNTWYNYQDWEVGSGLMFDDSCLHIGINAGMKPKITMQISGFYRG